MRIHIDVNETYSDIEVVIKTPVLNDDVIALQKALSQMSKQNMTLTMCSVTIDVRPNRQKKKDISV